MATFADGEKPQVMDAIREEKIPFKAVLKFNNSALFALNTGSSAEIQRLFWKVGETGYEDCFKAMIRLTPRSLTLTREVLRERHNLPGAIEGIQQLIWKGTTELDQIEQEERFLRQHKRDIEANRDFEVNVNVQVKDELQVPPGRFVTNCSICHMTCHKN
jgi:hypothetical protein